VLLVSIILPPFHSLACVCVCVQSDERNSKQLKHAKSSEARVTKRLDEVMQQLADVQSTSFAATEDLKQAVHELDNLKKHQAKLTTQAEKAQGDADKNRVDALDAKAHSRSCQEDLDMLQSHSDQLVADLEQQLKALTRDRAELEEELRHEFGAQLKEILAERISQFTRENEENMAEMKAVYDRKWEDYAKDLTGASKRGEEAEEQLEDLKDRAVTEKRRATDAVAKVAMLQVQLEEAEAELVSSNERHVKAIGKKNEELDAAREKEIDSKKEVRGAASVCVCVEITATFLVFSRSWSLSLYTISHLYTLSHTHLDGQLDRRQPVLAPRDQVVQDAAGERGVASRP
jgi:chromosome segregation ATPase